MFFIIIPISFFLGIYAIFYERRLRERNRQQIKLQLSVFAQCSSEGEYYKNLENFLHHSGYSLDKQDERLYITKKLFHIGYFLMGLSCFGVGAIFYLIYFYFFAKSSLIIEVPHFQYSNTGEIE
ncbi:hypothetical protein CCZ01_06880 [Helicobacter monodelphidis]|uniref:hypothetical protein n=1 Tax=Helicobacter sp. 15-1451 TaxID=2004995 RepID=UPI000DCBD9AC|nr:hypothetical protein [Helicobacter sp. 15-1451]RAX57182.1 hypothetical protein CCZ01_06880 [Helicobacter sp. 15-1451]